MSLRNLARPELPGHARVRPLPTSTLGGLVVCAPPWTTFVCSYDQPRRIGSSLCWCDAVSAGKQGAGGGTRGPGEGTGRACGGAGSEQPGDAREERDAYGSERGPKGGVQRSGAFFVCFAIEHERRHKRRRVVPTDAVWCMARRDPSVHKHVQCELVVESRAVRVCFSCALQNVVPLLLLRPLQYPVVGFVRVALVLVVLVVLLLLLYLCCSRLFSRCICCCWHQPLCRGRWGFDRCRAPPLRANSWRKKGASCWTATTSWRWRGRRRKSTRGVSTKRRQRAGGESTRSR